MTDGFPFSPDRIAALGRLAATINAAAAPPPIAVPVVIDEAGRVTLPVPDFDPPVTTDNRTLETMFEYKMVTAQLHAGMTLQWAPIETQGGLLIEFRGGQPDGDETRDAVACFLTRRGLKALIADLTAIEASL